MYEGVNTMTNVECVACNHDNDDMAYTYRTLFDNIDYEFCANNLTSDVYDSMKTCLTNDVENFCLKHRSIFDDESQ